MTQFKRILKSRRPAAVKPWEEAPETIAQPHVEAGREAEIDEVRDARGSTPGSVAPTPDGKRSTGASDVPGPQDSGVAAPSLRRADGGPISRTVDSSKEVYTDRSVCRALGIRRRVLGAARTFEARGRDWDALGEEAGMTLAWIRAFARDNGVPFVEENLEPVTGEYVSVRFDAPHPNIFLCLVKIEATGKIEYCRVRNRMEHSLHYLETFSVIRKKGDGNVVPLEWIAQPNECKW